MKLVVLLLFCNFFFFFSSALWRSFWKLKIIVRLTELVPSEMFSSRPADLYNVLTDWFTEVHWCVATTSTINIVLNTGIFKRNGAL